MRVSGSRPTRAAGLLACASNRPHVRPSFPGAESSHASRADPGFLCCVPNAKESTSPNNAPSAQRPSGAAGRTRWLRPSPADGASNPRRPCEGPRRALGSGRLSSREGHAPTPRTTREARRAARRARPPRTTARLPGPPAARPRASGETASYEDATWLILPVVICLSQRLSHACVSMN